MAEAPLLVPYLIVDDAAAAIAFYAAAFGAEQVMRLDTPDGEVAHAEIRLPGGAPVYLSSMTPSESGTRYASPAALGGVGMFLMMNVPDVDAATARAEQAGASIDSPPEDQFYGDRCSTVADPWGHRWTLATHVRDVSEQEMQQAMAAMG